MHQAVKHVGGDTEVAGRCRSVEEPLRRTRGYGNHGADVSADFHRRHMGRASRRSVTVSVTGARSARWPAKPAASLLEGPRQCVCGVESRRIRAGHECRGLHTARPRIEQRRPAVYSHGTWTHVLHLAQRTLCITSAARTRGMTTSTSAGSGAPGGVTPTASSFSSGWTPSFPALGTTTGGRRGRRLGVTARPSCASLESLRNGLL